MGITNGNGNKTRLSLESRMGMGMNYWEWQGIGLKKTFSLASNSKLTATSRSMMKTRRYQ